MNQEEYERIKASFGMWMYESFQDMLHVGNYNFQKLGIKTFARSEIIDMAIAIFHKRVELELQKAEAWNENPALLKEVD